ncbi:Chitinase [hydrothermal vent metagenome]|uniref:Chitinase n=1 Tax=hydrothermal vent metagenome TaxID=652676 RepID=A0A3B1E6T9_9ZZZZ
MKNLNKKLYLQQQIILVLFLLLNGCGGRGEVGDSLKFTIVGSKVSGIVHANYVKNATIKLYGINDDGTHTPEPIYIVTSDANGGYEFKNIQTVYKAYLIEAIGGEYIDEATGKILTLKTPLKSITYIDNYNDVVTVAVTPITDVVIRILENIGNDLSKKSREDIAREVVEAILGESGLDLNVFDTLPINLDDTKQVENSSKNQRLYSTLMAALSRYQAKSGKSVEEISKDLASLFQNKKKKLNNLQTPDNNRTIPRDDYDGQANTPEEGGVLKGIQDSFLDVVKDNKNQGEDSGIDVPDDATTDTRTTNQYIPGTLYESGDVVVQDGIEYICKEGSVGAWCKNISYAPGISSIWSYAWDSTGGTAIVQEERVSDLQLWSSSVTYKAGDKVYYNGEAYSCKGWPNTARCSDRAYAPIDGSIELYVMEAWSKYRGTYTVDASVTREENADDNKISQIQRESSSLALEQPVTTVIQSPKAATLFITAEYTNESNKPLGYIIFKDNRFYKQVEWTTYDERRASEFIQKDSSSHTYYVRTYNVSRYAGSDVRSQASVRVTIDAETNVSTAKGQTQHIITPTVTLLQIKPGEYSGNIFIQGGNGDGEFNISVQDSNVLEVVRTNNDAQFIIHALQEGNTTIVISKKASSDGTYIQSNEARIRIIVREETSSTGVFSEKPSKPVIGWISPNISYGDFTVFWSMTWRVKGRVVNFYINDTLQKKVYADDFDTNDGQQRGSFGLENNVTVDTQTTFRVELCNGADEDICTTSNPVTVTLLKANSNNNTPIPQTDRNGNTVHPITQSTRAQTPPSDHSQIFRSDHFAVGYLPSLEVDWFSKQNSYKSKIADIDSLYTHVVISFAKPNLTYISGSFNGTGLQFSMPFDNVKQAIKLLKEKGVKVLLGVGGHNYNEWAALANGENNHSTDLVRLINDLGFDGLDIDYDVPGADYDNIEQYYQSIQALYLVAQETETMLTLAAWSTGADCTIETASDDYCSNRTSFWTGSASRERQLFKIMRSRNLDPNDIFDYISIISYSNSFKNFDPIESYKNYRDIYNGKLAIGFELATERWPGAELVSTSLEARKCDISNPTSTKKARSSMLFGNSYTQYTIKKEYSVERFIKFIRNQPNSGIMLWSMYKFSEEEPACKEALDYEAFNNSARKFLVGKILTRDEQLQEDINNTYNMISNFKQGDKFTNLQSKAEALAYFEVNTTNIDANISLAVTKYDNNNSTKEELRNDLLNILVDMNKDLEEQLNSYMLIKIKHEAEEEDLRKLNQAKDIAKLIFDSFVKMNTNISSFKTTIDDFYTLVLSYGGSSYNIDIDNFNTCKQQLVEYNATFTSTKNNMANSFQDVQTLYSDMNDLNTSKDLLTAVGKKDEIIDKFSISSTKLKGLIDKFLLLRKEIIFNIRKDANNTFPDGSIVSESIINDLIVKDDDIKDYIRNKYVPEGINIIKYFTQEVTKLGTSGVTIKLTYNKTSDVNFRNAQILVSGDTGYNIDFSSNGAMSWTLPTKVFSFDTASELYITTLTFDSFPEKHGDALLESNSELVLKFWPSNIDDYTFSGDKPALVNNKEVKVVQIIPGKDILQKEDKNKAKPNRADPVSLKVKGWPSYLAMSTVTDNDFTINQNFYDSKVDSIFKYEGDGFGDRGDVIDPIVTLQTIRQSREIEALDSTGQLRVMPALVVYTANGSGGGLAPNDIKPEWIGDSKVSGDLSDTQLLESNLVKHFRNTIRMAAQMQANKDANHLYPATIILDADLFGEWQKNKLNGTFQSEYCGGSDDTDCENFQTIRIKESMILAIEAEKDYIVKKYFKTSTNYAKTIDVGTLENSTAKLGIDTLDVIKAKITSDLIKDNIKGWVQSQNFMIKEFAPDVPFGWVINLWNPGSAHWVHKKYTGERDLWENASKGVATFVQWIGAYDNDNNKTTPYAYKPDFLVFDKYERDGFGAAGKPSYAFSSRAWDNYLMYVKQITDFIDTPAMIWQIPGGHMVAKGEDLTGEARLCSDNDSQGCFRHLDSATRAGHSASGGTYFMGDKLIGDDITNIQSDVLEINITGAHYKGTKNGPDVHNVEDLLNEDPTHDWGESQLRHAVASNVFSIFWGGGETTGAVAISTNKTGGYIWLKNKLVDYYNKRIPLYHVDTQGSSNANITSLPTLNISLQDVESDMDKNVLLFNTGTDWVPSTIYKWRDFLKALSLMHNTGVAGDTFWLYDINDTNDQKENYAKVAIASFLAQSMQETIQYDACDENSWQFLKDAAISHAVSESINRGDFDIDLPMDAACGQLGQVYADYGEVNGVDNPYSCPRTPKMEVTAVTNARYYGAAGPLFSAPDSVLKNLLLDGKPGRWEYSGHCQGVPATDPSFEEPTNEGWLRAECRVYKGQKAGSYIWDGSSKRSLEGCSWWGRGVIQTTGRQNFGTLNHFIGRSHVDKSIIGQDVTWAGSQINVKPAPDNPLFADMDLCSNPELICSSQKHKEIKWIAGLFFWMNSVQAYKADQGKYQGWNYKRELKKYVDSNFGKNNYKPLNGISFIDAVSGIVNRGCPDKECPVSGLVHGAKGRIKNFKKVMSEFGITVQ